MHAGTARSHTFLAYSMISDDKDYEINKKVREKGRRCRLHAGTARSHTFLAYSMISDDKDYEINKKEEDYIS